MKYNEALPIIMLNKQNDDKLLAIQEIVKISMFVEMV